jgi:hypothetical protein
MNAVVLISNVYILLLSVMMDVSVLMMSAMKKLASVPTPKYTVKIMMPVHKTIVYRKLVATFLQ